MRLKEGSGALLEEMKQHLPIPARLTKEACKLLNQEGMHIDMNREINIVNVFDSGDAGGITCAIEGDGKKVIVISVTHLIINPDHPLSDKIKAYQKQRIKRLKIYG
jgi:hypothetical protein